MQKQGVRSVQEFELDVVEQDDGHLEFIKKTVQFDDDGITFVNYVDRWGTYKKADEFQLSNEAVAKLEKLLQKRKKK
jgi:hypothetical protein